MGTPPWSRSAFGYDGLAVGGAAQSAPPPMSAPAPSAVNESAKTKDAEAADQKKAGLARVAIGHGEPEGPYNAGSGFRGARAEEPIRVTVVYFVTPVGKVTAKDMETFSAAFAQWDTQAIWGGSFVTKESL
jgi:hypothetical protein